MASILDDLRAQARILHRRAEAGDAEALERLRAAGVGEAPVKRGHCLSAIARELGFEGWPHAVAVIGGDAVGDYGTLLYPTRHVAYWNIWCATYDEAATIRAEHGGYLLPYKHQFLVVDADYIRTIGVDPDDPDWAAIGRDWMHPTDASARERLYAKVIRGHQAREGLALVA